MPGALVTYMCEWLSGIREIRRLEGLEREKGIEPSPLAWEASVLPLNYSRAPSK
jgi:hypothetical protein